MRPQFLDRLQVEESFRPAETGIGKSDGSPNGYCRIGTFESVAKRFRCFGLCRLDQGDIVFMDAIAGFVVGIGKVFVVRQPIVYGAIGDVSGIGSLFPRLSLDESFQGSVLIRSEHVAEEA